MSVALAVNERNIRYTLNLKLKKQDVIFFGSGPAELLDLVEETSSLYRAAARMDMAYSKAWRIIKTAEQQLGFALLDRSRGGAHGGGSSLTERAKVLLERYRLFQQDLYIQGDRLYARYFGDLL